MSNPAPKRLTGLPLVQRVVHLLVTLLLIFGLTLLARWASPTQAGVGEITLLIGFLLLVASVAGSLAASSSEAQGRQPDASGPCQMGHAPRRITGACLQDPDAGRLPRGV